MRLAHVSIDRPVLTLVLSVFIMVLGFIALPFLGVREFPSVDPPRISVSTSRRSTRVSTTATSVASVGTSFNALAARTSDNVMGSPFTTARMRSIVVCAGIGTGHTSRQIIRTFTIRRPRRC